MRDYILKLPDVGIYYRDDKDMQFKINKLIQYNRESRSAISNTLTDLLMEIKPSFIYHLNNFFNIDYTDIDVIPIIKDFISEVYSYYHDIYEKYNISKSKFIVFEGCDGVGKDYILDRIDLSDYPIVYTREPGGPEISELIRDIVLDKKYKDNMSYRTEFLLYCASRAQHVDEVIIPALQSGYHVISNRFYHSSLIYQKLRGLDDSYLKTLTEFAINDTNPDVVFSLYSDAKIISDRIDSKDKDRLEMEGDTFFSNVNNMYKNIDSNLLINSISQSTKYIPVDTSTQSYINYIKDSLMIYLKV